jgi:ribosomal protein S3
VPLGTLRAHIDCGMGTAHTTAGCIGTKVWVCRGDLVPLERTRTVRKPVSTAPAVEPPAPAAPR